MKKLFLTGLVALLVGSASAQIVTSRSRLVTKVKTPRKAVWVVHAGVGMDNMSTTDHYGGMSVDVKGRFGYDAGIQFNRPVTKHSYWGMDLSYGSTGCEFESNGSTNYYWGMYDPDLEVSYSGKVREQYLQFSPVIYGWKIPVGSQCAVDLHVEAYTAYRFSGSNETVGVFHGGNMPGAPWEDEDGTDELMDFGVKVGAGFWFKKIKWDFMYRQGFVDGHIAHERYGFQCAMAYSLLFSVGYAF